MPRPNPRPIEAESPESGLALGMVFFNFPSDSAIQRGQSLTSLVHLYLLSIKMRGQ